MPDVFTKMNYILSKYFNGCDVWGRSLIQPRLQHICLPSSFKAFETLVHCRASAMDEEYLRKSDDWRHPWDLAAVTMPADFWRHQVRFSQLQGNNKGLTGDCSFYLLMRLRQTGWKSQVLGNGNYPDPIWWRVVRHEISPTRVPDMSAGPKWWWERLDNPR